MDTQQEAFENELRGKLLYKSSSKVGPENAFLKIFKFFDLSNEGTLKKPDFLKAIAKAGVVLSDVSVIKQYYQNIQKVANHLFQIYSKGAESVNYREFIAQVLAEGEDRANGENLPYEDKIQHLSSQGFQMAGPSQVGHESFNQLIFFKKIKRFRNSLDILRAKLSLRGSQGLISFARALKAVSSQNFISINLFQDVAKQQRLEVDPSCLALIFTQADRQEQGIANIDDILGVIKGNYPSQYRQIIVQNIFKTFQSPKVNVHQLVNRYNAERHPDVRHLNKRPEELREEFVACLEQFLQFKQKKNLQDVLGFQEFSEFYHYFWFHVHNDELFRSIANSVWDLDQQHSPPRITNTAHMESQNDRPQLQHQPDQISQAPSKQQQSPRSVAQSSKSSVNTKQVELIVQRIKNRLSSRGAKGFISMYRLFKMLDIDRDGLLNLSEFRRAVRDHKIEVTDPEIDLVFSYFDRDNSGLIDLWGFMFVLKGDMNQVRISLIEQLFLKLDKNSVGFVTLSEIKQQYQARYHPDVKSGKRQDDEVLQDFMETFTQLHHVNGGFGNEDVGKEEFMEYFSNLSASIDDDKYFEQIVSQVFRLNQDNASLYSNYAGGKKTFEPDHKKGYLQDHHRHLVVGGSVSANAPFGTFQDNQSVVSGDQKSVQSRPQSAFVQPQSFNIFKPLEDAPRRNYEQPLSQLGQSQLSQKSQQQQPQQQVHYPIEQQTPQSKQKLDSFQIVRNKVLSRGLRGLIGLQGRFRLYDRQHLSNVSFPEFVKVFRSSRLEVTDKDLQSVFTTFEVSSSGVMNYESFIKGIQGTMTLRKFNVVQNAFDSLQKDKQQLANIQSIIDCYNGKNHPDVRMNRKREDEVLCEFVDTFEMHHLLHSDTDYVQNPSVSFEEFISYYNNLNPLVEDEAVFEQILQGVWQLKQRRF